MLKETPHNYASARFQTRDHSIARQTSSPLHSCFQNLIEVELKPSGENALFTLIMLSSKRWVHDYGVNRAL